MEHTKSYVITFNRQSGSGSASVGQQLQIKRICFLQTMKSSTKQPHN